MSGQNSMVVVKPWLRVGCTLGEGPLYDPATSTLHFVDIEERKVYHASVPSGEVTVDTFDEPVSCLVLRRGGLGLACAAARGFATLGPDSALNYVAQPLSEDGEKRTRFNDGACDSAGRFLAGTVMCQERNIPGHLYIHDPADGSCKMLDGPFTDSNGLGWSPDNKTLYFTDSLVNKIYAYDYDAGNISNRRLFVDAVSRGFAPDSYCDGLCVDVEGFIWSARWGGSRIVRFALDGSVDFEIHFPTALNVTSCCFGGENNDQMYVTTAHCGANGGDASRQARYPDSGHVFSIDFAGRFKGLIRYEFAG